MQVKGIGPGVSKSLVSAGVDTIEKLLDKDNNSMNALVKTTNAVKVFSCIPL
jgi:predicted RecB family nuclease